MCMWVIFSMCLWCMWGGLLLYCGVCVVNVCYVSGVCVVCGT